jgi:FKBP-type peptidyl-prolyl cis-trans isomerase SlyD
VVAEIGDEKVKMDFNSPMAGRDLHFAGEVLDIRQATKEELEHGHVHGPEGHHH